MSIYPTIEELSVLRDDVGIFEAKRIIIRRKAIDVVKEDTVISEELREVLHAILNHEV